MEGYVYPEQGYPRPADGYPGPDGYEYYDMAPMSDDHGDGRRPSRSKRSPNRPKRKEKRCHSKSSGSRTESRSTSKTRSRSESRSRSASGSRKNLAMREPSFMDAFRVAYMTPRKHKKNTPKYLATQKREDHIRELLKIDRLGSKRWLFYPRSQTSAPTDIEESRESCDQRIKVDGDFLRKYKRSKNIDHDAPIAKLKRWELVLYKKLGFIQAV